MLRVKYFPKDDDYGSFIAIETPTCVPVGTDEPILIDDPDIVRQLIEDLQGALLKLEASK